MAGGLVFWLWVPGGKVRKDGKVGSAGRAGARDRGALGSIARRGTRKLPRSRRRPGKSGECDESEPIKPARSTAPTVALGPPAESGRWIAGTSLPRTGPVRGQVPRALRDDTKPVRVQQPEDDDARGPGAAGLPKGLGGTFPKRPAQGDVDGGSGHDDSNASRPEVLGLWPQVGRLSLRLPG
jgi:hypothetical protein